MASALANLDLVVKEAGFVDLRDVHLLDVGCGTKLAKAIIEHDVPIGRYVGIDVNADVIALLQSQVHDSRFEFHHMNVYNELYNRQGTPLKTVAELPLHGEVFDAICLFSVFTHLNPVDYHEMLRLLRPHIKPDGRLIYSVFINNPTHPHAAVAARLANPSPEDLEAFSEALRTNHAEEFARAQAALADRDDGAGDVQGPPLPARELAEADSVPDFVEALPDQLGMWPMYSRRHAFDLIEGTGWRPLALHSPEEYVQHYFTCAPI